MKRFLVIPVMFIYLLAVSGIMITVHYCGPNMESWEMYAKNTDGCEGGECGDESQQNDGCCKDEVIAAKVSHDQNTVSAFKLKLSTTSDWAILPAPVYNLLQEDVPAIAQNDNTHQPNAPPGRWQQIPLFKLHSSFTYYG